MRKIISAIFILTSYFILHSSFSFAAENTPLTKKQLHTIDSLKQVLKTTDNKGKPKVYNEFAEKYIDVSYETALKYANEALKMAEQTGNISEKANALGILGLINYKTGNLKVSNNYYERALSIYIQKADKKDIAKITTNTGAIYLAWNNYDEAMKRYKKALQTYKELNDKANIAIALKNIGNVFKFKNQYREAEYYYQKSLTILYELGLKKEISRVLNNIGTIYVMWENNETALKYFQRALKIAEEIKNKENISMVLNNIGLIYKKIGKYGDALKNFTKILDIQNELKNKGVILTAYKNIGDVYERQGDFQKALYYYKKSYYLVDKKSIEIIAGLLNNFGNTYKKLGNYNVALKYFKQSISITDSINKFGDLSIKNYKDMSDLFEKMNDYKTSDKYLRQYYALNDSVYNKETHKQIIEINTKYETERKDKEIILNNKKIEILQRDKKITLLKLYMLAVTLLLIVIVGILIYNRQRIKTLKAEKNLQIQETQKSLMEAELNYKNKELMSIGMQIVQKNDFLENIIENLKDIEKNLKLNQTLTLSEIKKLTKTIRYNLNIEQDREKFIKHLELSSEGFYFRLAQKFPTLNKYEKQLCALLKYNLSSKEIGALFNINSRSVDNYRYLTRKKMNLESDENLSSFLNSI
ncbi:MAG: tetratricopeptide repeat protein [Bacteroidales bacterium]|jgi:tetratricopeptide (TPR) repeat protein/DNA-binding CsgD family transcriptional regulator